MAIDFIPLGAPELGMTRAEILDTAWASMEACLSLNDTFYTILFAYVVAMYLAGTQLTRFQYVIANVMYLLVMATTILGVHDAWLGFEASMGDAWASPRGLYNEVRPLVNTAVSVFLVILSIWFGQRIRHPGNA